MTMYFKDRADSKQGWWEQRAREGALYCGHVSQAMATGLPPDQVMMRDAQVDAWREIMLKARRQRLGLPERAPGNCQIRDD
mmetsp:Transcript_122449/g.280621  ORF Transcript_122449/g.280621 Transcript_122449/m.280621 type:complete len:81 (+) Transcript_122449:222-464(+)